MSNTKAERLNNILEERFGIRLDASSDDGHLEHVRDHYMAKRHTLIKQLGEAAAINHPTYAKAYLLSETARMLLREIAPKRLRKNRSK